MWTLEELPVAFKPVHELAYGCGYIAAIFGSVIRNGEGGDLDIAMIPIGNRYQDMVAFAKGFGGKVKHKNVNEARALQSYQIEKNGKIYHFVFGVIGG